MNGISIFAKGQVLKNCTTKRDEHFLKKCLISWEYDEQIQKLRRIIMPEQYKRFGIKVSKIDGLSLGACLSIDTYNEEGYLYINLIKWEVCIGWMWFEKPSTK